MVNIIINHGTGKTYGNIEQATKNIVQFIKDTGINFQSKYIRRSDNGRFVFEISNERQTHEIEMVGENIDSVRYIDCYKQDIYDFPRLYVDDSSYVWLFAITNITKESSYNVLKRLGYDAEAAGKYEQILTYSIHCNECGHEKMDFEEMKKYLRADPKNLDSFFKTIYPCNNPDCRYTREKVYI